MYNILTVAVEIFFNFICILVNLVFFSFRRYEERELQWHRERKARMLELDDKYEDIKNRLDFERDADKKGIFLKMEVEVENAIFLFLGY